MVEHLLIMWQVIGSILHARLTGQFISSYSQCSAFGVTKAAVCAFLSLDSAYKRFHADHLCQLGRKEMYYLTTQLSHFFFFIWCRTYREEARCCHTSCGALDGTRICSMGPPWRIDLTTDRTMSGHCVGWSILSMSCQQCHIHPWQGP